MMVRTTSIEIEKLARGAFATLGLVPADGYHWTSEEGRRWLRENEPLWLPGPAYGFARPALGRSYRGDPGLHRHFARLKGTEEEIERFANKYGRLWGPVGSLERLREIHPRALKPRESLEEWRTEIGEMARLLRLWDQARTHDAQSLHQAVTWRREPTRVYVEREIFASEGLAAVPTPRRPSRNLLPVQEGEEPVRPKLIEEWQYGDLVGPARFYVAAKVNEKLSGHVSPAVVPFTGGTGRAEVLFFPDSLLGALYALFALEITDYGYTRVCPFCGEQFRTTNRRKRYCSEACKKDAWEAEGRRRRPPSPGASPVKPPTGSRRRSAAREPARISPNLPEQSRG